MGACGPDNRGCDRCAPLTPHFLPLLRARHPLAAPQSPRPHKGGVRTSSDQSSKLIFCSANTFLDRTRVDVIPTGQGANPGVDRVSRSRRDPGDSASGRPKRPRRDDSAASSTSTIRYMCTPLTPLSALCAWARGKPIGEGR
ncbi:hypothetical protein DPEC_G00102550 [Dallia pectoralis]|uniref:Uncharacterized protein n=1 Tax=Dallia pectoralis TaxID=75939 RepID=A0ACC2GX30_DALPE|nr:hypothetical protein DPEC_G00102550 [Dallia pectoralis]